ncbi:ankyrin repeat-containing domain protein [Aspergillus pseudoustus]|uniref:Ankyrin repeat-containing domain protein n=1 Tax=Aspergillus pseudoustus TaxID=1810923 RepID=A0ABR4JGC3_9EURO
MADTDLYCPDSPKSPPELDWISLLEAIQQNDLPQLHHYVSSVSAEAIPGRTSPYYEDPFFLAASEAQPETLRILLDVYASSATTDPAETFKEKRGFSLTHVACRSANVEIVRFILDNRENLESRLALGVADLDSRDRRSDNTPIMEAAASLSELYLDAAKAENRNIDRNSWFHDRIEKAEQVIHLLLDRGCSATDVVPPLRIGKYVESQPQDSVLGLAVSRASKALVQRLITSGADVFLKHMHFHDIPAMFLFRQGRERVHDVTTLHKASMFWNADILGLLLDYRWNEEKFGRDLTVARDSNGGLPLHWAAAGPGRDECKLRDEELRTRISKTFQLLLSSVPGTINMADNVGFTPLHYAVQAHAACGGSAHAEAAIQCLLEHGADPTITSSNGQTVLHMLGYCSLGGRPISGAVLDSLMAHGVDINHANNKGITALHVMVQNLRQISTVRYLLEHGADPRTSITSTGNTAFHLVADGRLPVELITEDGEYKNTTAEDYIKAQDEMLRLLQASTGGDTLMGQRNLAGKTALELLREVRQQRRERLEQMRSGAGRGRGRGCGSAQRPGE